MGVGVVASSVVISTGTVIPTAILVEPFNDLTNWNATSGTPTIVTGRTGTAVQIDTNVELIDYTIPAISESDTVTMGFAFRWTDATTTQRGVLILRSGGTSHVRLMLTASTGILTVDRNGSALTGGNSAGGLVVANTWYYLELQAKLGDAPNGAATLRLNGTNVIGPLTGIDTKAGGTKAVWDTVRLIVNIGSATNQYDDLYLKVGAGQSFEGDTAIT